MDGKLSDEQVMCCFCGEALAIADADVLTIQPNIISEEKQQVFCHKEHLVQHLHRDVVLHPDLFEEE